MRTKFHSQAKDNQFELWVIWIEPCLVVFIAIVNGKVIFFLLVTTA